MSTYEDNYYRNILVTFQISDLQNLLTTFGRSKNGRKQELLDRAINVLIKKPAGINRQLFLAKINEIHQTVQLRSNMSNNRIKMMGGTMLNQHQIMPSGMQTQSQRMITPQYSQQPSQQIPRAGLPYVIPQTQRGMYGGNINRNNNFQYSYQVGASHNLISQVSRMPLNEQSIIVSLNSMYGTNLSNTGNNSFASSQSLANISIQKLPFYEVVAECIKPTILYGSERCSHQMATTGMREAVFKLLMEPSHVNYISENLDVSGGRTNYLYQVHIRICLLKDGSTEITDFMPLGIHIRFGNKTCMLPPTPNTKPGAIARRYPKPILCTHLLKLNPTITQTIFVNWYPDELSYVFGMFIVKKLTPETLLIKLKEKAARSVDETKNDIIRKLSNVDPDLATTSYRVSIMCPLGQVRMKLPAKSVKCDHLQCFDAETFILMNEKKPTWTCPTCSKPCLYDDIHIEAYFLEVVTSPNLEDSSKEIELLSDGTWRVFRENNEPKNLESSANTKEKLINLVNLDDSDDNNPTELKKEINKCVQKQSGKLKSSFVDLTLNDNEDEASKENETIKKDKQENEAQAVDVVQPITTVVDTTPQVQPQQAVTSSIQDAIIELD